MIDVVLVGTGVSVITADDGSADVISATGVDVVSPDQGPQGIPARQDVVLFLQGGLNANELLARIECAGAAVYGPNSLASAGLASMGTAVITVTRNGQAFAAITFAASATGTVAFLGSGAVIAGDVLAFTAPASPDATLANVSITLASA
jgi:hypothetical protein